MDWKKLAKTLLFPPGWLIILLTLASAALLTLVFLKGTEQSAAAYGIYVLSFYTLTVGCICSARVMPGKWRQLHARVSQNSFIRRYGADRQFRTRVSLYQSLNINVLYIALQAWQWYAQRSWWFVVLAVYYGIMSLMRFLLMRYVRRNEIGLSLLAEWKRSRTCACILLLVNLSLTAAVLMILYQGKGAAYDGILIYVIALYTFYSLIHAAVELVKYRKMGSPVLSTAKIVSLSAALVSLLNLETAMFDQFGGDLAPEHQRLIIILTGAGISVIVVTLSVSLIRRANNAIRREHHGAS